MQAGLYKLDCTIQQKLPVTSSPATFHLASNLLTSPQASLLHRRLGHPGMHATRDLLKGNAVHGLLHRAPDCPNNYCVVCKNCRECRMHFGSSLSSHPPTAPLEYVHSDLMGPFECRSLGGHLYTCSLYDQYTGYGEMFLLRSKDEVNPALRKAIYRWQRQTGCKLKIIRTDNGGEHMGKFHRFLEHEGIIHQRSAPYTPEQNGVAERYNRSIIEKTRCMLNEFTVPKFLWAEAIRTAVHIRNLIPKTGHAVTPYEHMFGRKPSVDHLRVFGCSSH
jgi:transposase InsO family protein